MKKLTTKQSIMKKILLFFILTLAISVTAQDYCDYDEQKTYDFGASSFDTPYLMLEQNDGKILMLGTSNYSSSNSYKASLLRLNQNNTLDETFGENGKAGHTWSQRNTCISGALQDDNKILLGGIQAPGNGGSTYRAYVARLMSDGSPDLTFGDNGSMLLDTIIGRGSVVGLKQLDNGKIQAIVIGNSPTGYHAMVQLDEFGAYDTTFGNNGVAYNPVLNVIWQDKYGKGLFLEDGSVIVVGKAFVNPTTKPCITKLTSEGDLDSNFAVNGTLYIERAIQYNYAGIHAALTYVEDIIIAATSEEAPKKYLLFKVDEVTGAMENDFSSDGYLESSQSSSFNAVHEVIVDQVSGGIHVFGTGGASNWTPNVWTVSSTGIEENGCDGNSMQTFPLGNNYSQGYYAALHTSTGDMRISGNSGVADTTSGDNQVMNFMIPINSLATGIDKFKEIAFNIYPNPGVNKINISTDDNTLIDKIKIYNQLGQELIQAYNVNTIEISSLPKGVYIIEVISGASIVRKKLIKR